MRRKDRTTDLKRSGKGRYSASREAVPSRLEQETARDYCCRRALHRPHTTVKTAVKWLLMAEGLSLATAFFLRFLFGQPELCNLFSMPRLSNLFFYSAGSITAFILCIKKLLIVAVELYQHYAPEAVRRRCILMPTCSEYAILALRKYGVIVGLYRIYIRLAKTCRGNVYRTDYP